MQKSWLTKRHIALWWNRAPNAGPLLGVPPHRLVPPDAPEVHSRGLQAPLGLRAQQLVPRLAEGAVAVEPDSLGGGGSWRQGPLGHSGWLGQGCRRHAQGGAQVQHGPCKRQQCTACEKTEVDMFLAALCVGWNLLCNLGRQGSLQRRWPDAPWSILPRQTTIGMHVPDFRISF